MRDSRPFVRPPAAPAGWLHTVIHADVPPIPDDYWFDAIATHLGTAYLRNAFTKGTEQEVEFLVGALGLGPGMRVLDVGCGPGRHALSLARRGLDVLGVDHSPDFVRLARDAAEAEGLSAEFLELDVRDLSFDGRIRRRHLPLPGRLRAPRRPRRAGRLPADRRARSRPAVGSR